MSFIPEENDPATIAKHSPAAVDFVQLLFGTLRNRQLYPTGHKILVAGAERLIAALPAALSGQRELNIGIVDGRLILGEYPLSQGLSPSASQLRPLQERGVERITFAAECEPEDVAELLNALAVEDPERSPKEYLASVGVRTIRVGRLSSGGGGGKGRRSLTALYNELYHNAVLAVRDLIGLCQESGALQVGAAQDAVDQVVLNATQGEEQLLDLTNLPRQDEESFSHALNTCILSVSLGRSLGLSEQQLRDLGTAALLHDIGKTALPQEVVHKEGELTEEERLLMERHPVLGANLLRKLSGVGNVSARVALEHHMHYDGSGYPARVRRRRLHLATQMVAIANTYDNIRTHQAKVEEITCERALRIMAKGVGREFEPTLLKRFVNHLGLYPRGTLVLLSNGMTGLVAEIRPGHPIHPKVRVIQNQEGEMLSAPFEIDLYHSALEAEPVTVLQSMDARVRGVEPLDYLD